MAAPRKKHPALPAEPGWTLCRIGPTGKPSQRGKWRVGYVGKKHPRRVIIKDTEAEAIAYLQQKYAEFHSPRKIDDVAQRWLCRRLVA